MARIWVRQQSNGLLGRDYLAPLLIVLLSVSSLLLTSYIVVSSEEVEQWQRLDKLDWWKKTNFYHIYLRSFKDSDGDGNGDLRGVIEKLDYLKQIGVETILMAPFYSSPMKDGGYDIDNYVGIQPMFGTMADFDELMKQLKLRNMRMVVDFVPNHSSNKHPWFICSERALLEPERCGKYKDYYVWTDSKRFEGKYPSNWISVFGGGPAWTWSELRQQFYLHQFLPEQPDFNFRNPAVREEFKNIARFWLNKGADGLRVDAIIHLIEDANFTDELPNPDWKEGQDPFRKLLHTSTMAQHESAEVVGEWHRMLEQEFAHDKKVIVTEAYYYKIEKLIEYYGSSATNHYSDLPFNAQLFVLEQDNLNANLIEKIALDWIEPARALNWPDEQGAMSPWILWMTGNHDNPRIANKIGKRNVAFLQLLTYILPGVPLNYYGDELPLENANFSSIPQRTIDEGEPSRLVFRAPMAWTSDELNGGFSSNASGIWMPLNANWKVTNVEHLLSEASDPHNELKFFANLQALRNKHMDIFAFGDLVFFHNNDDHQDGHQSVGQQAKKSVLAIARTHSKFGNLLMLANMDSNKEAIVRLAGRGRQSVIKKHTIEPPNRGRIVLVNRIDSIKAPQVQLNASVQLDGLVLASSQVILISYESPSSQKSALTIWREIVSSRWRGQMMPVNKAPPSLLTSAGL